MADLTALAKRFIADCGRHEWQTLKGRDVVAVCNRVIELEAADAERERVKLAVFRQMDLAQKALGVDGLKLDEIAPAVAKLVADLAMANQVSGELCPKCGFAMKFPGEPCRCELEAEVKKLRETVGLAYMTAQSGTQSANEAAKMLRGMMRALGMLSLSQKQKALDAAEEVWPGTRDSVLATMAPEAAQAAEGDSHVG